MIMTCANYFQSFLNHSFYSLHLDKLEKVLWGNPAINPDERWVKMRILESITKSREVQYSDGRISQCCVFYSEHAFSVTSLYKALALPHEVRWISKVPIGHSWDKSRGMLSQNEDLRNNKKKLIKSKTKLSWSWYL